jgi:hypothetical protein
MPSLSDVLQEAVVVSPTVIGIAGSGHRDLVAGHIAQRPRTETAVARAASRAGVLAGRARSAIRRGVPVIRYAARSHVDGAGWRAGRVGAAAGARSPAERASADVFLARFSIVRSTAGELSTREQKVRSEPGLRTVRRGGLRSRAADHRRIGTRDEPREPSPVRPSPRLRWCPPLRGVRRTVRAGTDCRPSSHRDTDVSPPGLLNSCSRSRRTRPVGCERPRTTSKWKML